MKKLQILLIAGAAAFHFACNPLEVKELVDPNNPSESSVLNNATRRQVQFLVTC